MAYKMRFFIGVVLALLFAQCNIYAETHWEPSVELGTNATDIPDGNPKIVGDPAGNAAVTWAESGEVFASYRTAGGLWETPVNLGKGEDPNICVDDAGNVTIAFLAPSGNGIVYAAYRPIGGTWEAAASIHTDVGKTFEDVAVSCTSASTQAIVVWSNTSDSIVHSVSRVGTVWQSVVTAVNVGAGTINSNSKPQVHMLPDGNTQMALYIASGANQGINYTKASPPPVVWDALTHISGFDAAASVKFSFATNSNGDGIIVSQDTGDGKAAALISGSWGTAATMGLASPNNMSVGLDKNGLATAVWVIPGTGEIQTKSVPLTSLDWALPVTLSTGSGNGTPILDISDDGHMIVGWRDNAKLFNTKRGLDGTFESTTALVTANQVDVSTIATNIEGRGFAAWTESSGRATVSMTYEPYDPYERLAKAGSNKRLIYQKGIRP